MAKQKKNKKKVNWLSEIGDAFASIFRGAKGLFAVILFILTSLFIVAVLCGLIMGAAFAVYLSGYVDAKVENFEILASEQKQTSQIYVDNGSGGLNELENQKLYGSENRVWVDYNDIPQYLIDAYIAMEDKRFMEHHGVDWIRTAKATLYYMMGRSSEAGGGSTLTQQLIKNITGDNDNSPQRKIEEMFRALNLEKEYSKQQILEMYLNTIYLSQGCNGVQAASYAYFNKPVSQLNLVECAAIAAITQNPSRWDPKIHPENNIIRRNHVLDYMLEQGKITKAEYDEAYDKELNIYYPPEDVDDENPGSAYTDTVTSWYIDAVIEDAVKLLMEHYNVSYVAAEQMLYTGGLKIVTAMDQNVQDILEATYKNNDIIDGIVGAKPGMVKPQSAMVVVNPHNGNILGLVGGRGEKAKSRVFNYATQARRQTGSSIKPRSVYGPALQAGVINYGAVFDDGPYQYNGKDPWPKNSPAGYKGLTPVITGITNSVNTVAIKIIDKLGLEYSYNFLTKKLHITSLYDRQIVNGKVVSDLTLASLGLGGMTYGVSVREMVGGYTMFTNDGVFCEPRTVLKICDTGGEVLIDNELKTEICLSRENASIMTQMMHNVTEEGTGKKTTLKKHIFTAGKTGTTTSNYDKWFIGFTPYYLAGVWFGYEKSQTLNPFPGNPAMKIWDNVMTKLHEQLVFARSSDGKIDYTKDKEGKTIPMKYEDIIDPGVLKLDFCMDCGLLACEACKQDSRGKRIMTGYFTPDNMPTGYCTCHRTICICSVSGRLATEHCPQECRSYVNIVVNDLVKLRNPDGHYTRQNDGGLIYYQTESGTYGGGVKSYAYYCTYHSGGEVTLQSPPALLPDEDRRFRG